ncbi:hypothetical protein TNCV_1729971 [Trichonephila clavipes]|nr:hypothetical protein TNCV_1729971 [Trichonephila clavipes]
MKFGMHISVVELNEIVERVKLKSTLKGGYWSLLIKTAVFGLLDLDLKFVNACRTAKYLKDYIDSCVKMVNFTASADGRGRSRTVRQTHLEEVILDHGDETLCTSTRALACRLRVSQPTV